MLVRTARCVEGSAEIHLDCEPAFDYGGLAAEWRYSGSGYHEATAVSEGMDLELCARHRHAPRLRGAAREGAHDPAARATSRSSPWAGREHALPATYEEASERLERTAHYWQEWLKHGAFPDHPWRTYLQRSALTLKGLTYAPTGAMIAAATTSLPETPGGERNWDYRYTWIRDSTFMLWALYTLGFDWEANDFFYFVADVAEAEEAPAADHVRHRRGERPHRADARPPLGLRRARGRCASATAPTTSTSTTSGARSSTRSTSTPSRATSSPERIWPIIKRQVDGRARATGASPTGASGRCAASPSTSPRRR